MRHATYFRKDAAHGRRFKGSKKKDERSRKDSLCRVGWAVWRPEDQGDENSLKGCKDVFKNDGNKQDLWWHVRRPPKKVNFSCQKRQFSRDLRKYFLTVRRKNTRTSCLGRVGSSPCRGPQERVRCLSGWQELLTLPYGEAVGLPIPWVPLSSVFYDPVFSSTPLLHMDRGGAEG